mmetsp:Transcript_1534/g.3335  ORF Transcript_1534/g.3335 Transcript_1534/m.3335 type:complete len:86 (-) Transcript_1534:415-672(-)
MTCALYVNFIDVFQQLSETIYHGHAPRLSQQTHHPSRRGNRASAAENHRNVRACPSLTAQAKSCSALGEIPSQPILSRNMSFWQK